MAEGKSEEVAETLAEDNKQKTPKKRILRRNAETWRAKLAVAKPGSGKTWQNTENTVKTQENKPFLRGGRENVGCNALLFYSFHFLLHHTFALLFHSFTTALSSSTHPLCPITFSLFQCKNVIYCEYIEELSSWGDKIELSGTERSLAKWVIIPRVLFSVLVGGFFVSRISKTFWVIISGDDGDGPPLIRQVFLSKGGLVLCFVLFSLFFNKWSVNNFAGWREWKPPMSASRVDLHWRALRFRAYRFVVFIFAHFATFNHQAIENEM